jgi:hypothetical protein
MRHAASDLPQSQQDLAAGLNDEWHSSQRIVAGHGETNFLPQSRQVLARCLRIEMGLPLLGGLMIYVKSFQRGLQVGATISQSSLSRIFTMLFSTSKAPPADRGPGRAG